MGSILTVVLLIVFVLIVAGAVAGVVSSLGRRHKKHEQGRSQHR